MTFTNGAILLLAYISLQHQALYFCLSYIVLKMWVCWSSVEWSFSHLLTLCVCVCMCVTHTIYIGFVCRWIPSCQTTMMFGVFVNLSQILYFETELFIYPGTCCSNNNEWPTSLRDLTVAVWIILSFFVGSGVLIDALILHSKQFTPEAFL